MYEALQSKEKVLGSSFLDSSIMFVGLFTQQLFIELLWCARYFLGTKETAVKKMNEVPALLGVTFQFGETNKTHM